jgi:transposase
MLTDESVSFSTSSLNHYGLVAATCKMLGIAEKIDKKLGKKDERRILTPGVAVVAMIINGLGFTNNCLYLTAYFFKNKPVDLLLSPHLKSENITDDTLAKALDEIYAYGTTKLFAEIAAEIALEFQLLGGFSHLDTTSFSLQGDYDCYSEDENEPRAIKVTYGHSKDKRPDLKQIILSLVMNGPAHIPIWMEGLDGNSSDKTNFHETIKKMREFQKELNFEEDFTVVADSALYTLDKLLAQDYLWICRIPETIKEAKSLVEKENVDWIECEDKRYKMHSILSEYGKKEQRWFMFFSQEAYDKERITFIKNIKKNEEKIKKEAWHLSHKSFECAQDALKDFEIFKNKNKMFNMVCELEEKFKYIKKGHPKEGDPKRSLGHFLKIDITINEGLVNKELETKGRFILGTNDLNKTDGNKILHHYKDQQHVERGFRFLKDPMFLLDKFFVKKPERIESLLVIMCFCLMVYNIMQYQIREKLKKEEKTGRLKSEVHAIILG